MDSEKKEAFYFRSVSLQNVRCFGEEAQTIHFTDQEGKTARWNIILGENGVGKTTVLRSLADFEPIWGEFMSSRVKSWNSYFSRDEKNSSNMIIHWANSLFKQHAQGKITHELTNVQRSRRAYDKNGNPKNISIKSKIIGFGASRRINTAALTDKEVEYENISTNGNLTRSLFDDEATLINAEEWLVQTDYRALRSGEKYRGHYEKVKNILLQLFEGEISDIKIEDEPFRVVFKTSYGWVRLHQLSLGYKTLIAWMVDLAAKMFNLYPDSKKPLAEAAVVLVDEIDLHMHPKLQRKLISFLTETFPNTQFIATAHSPLIVQSAEEANIILLKKEGDHVIVDNDVDNIQNWRIDQILVSDLFGLESARSPQVEKLIQEKAQLMAQFELNKGEQKRLEEINQALGFIPSSESPKDNEAMRIIHEAAEALKNRK